MGSATDRIRKLLAKAERAGTEAEADVYNAKAAELMARHGVDAALLAAATPGSDALGCTRIAVADPYSGGKARLLGWTATAMRCRWVLHARARGGVESVTVVGFASDRERAELLYTSLLVQASRELVRCRPPDPAESVAAYRRSWLYGFASRVHQRLTTAEEHAAREADAHDPGRPAAATLVLVDRAALVLQRFAEEFPHLATARRSTLSGSGFHAGALAATRADLGGPRIATRAGAPDA